MIRKIRKILLVLPIIIAVIIISITFLGFYLAEILGLSNSLLIPIIFATFGLCISIVFSLLLIRKELNLG